MMGAAYTRSGSSRACRQTSSPGGCACVPVRLARASSTVRGVVLALLVGGPSRTPASLSHRNRVEPAEADRKAFAAEQRGGLVERQADHVGVGADHLDHERAGDALHRVAAGFAAPFA